MKYQVSVIIPVFNGEKFIKSALNCLVFQKNLEIICVDDGSIDGTKNILYDYKKNFQNLQVIEIKHHGLGYARNTGIKKSLGEYVGFLDCDDLVDTDFFNKLYSKARDSDSDIAYGDLKVVSARGGSSDFDLEKYYKIIKKDKSFFYRNFSTAIYRTSFLIKNNIYFKNIFVSEDILFAHYAARASNKLVYVPGVSYIYNKFINENSISSVSCIDTSCLKSYYELILAFNRENLDKLDYQYECAEIIGTWFNHFVSLYVNSFDFQKSLYKVFDLLYCMHSLVRKGSKYYRTLRSISPLMSIYLRKKKIIKNKDFNFFELLCMDLKKNVLLVKDNFMFWGASNFLISYISANGSVSGCLGIIDISDKMIGKKIGDLKVYSPSVLLKKKVTNLLISVVHHQENILIFIRKYLKNNGLSNIKVLSVF